MSNNLLWQGDGWCAEVLYSRAGLSTSILIELKDGSKLILDCGDGCMRDIIDRELRMDRTYPFCDNQSIAVLLSHGHFDHIGGLHTLLGFLRMIGYRGPLPIISPRDSIPDRLLIESFQKTYDQTIPYRIDYRQVQSDEEFAFRGVRILPFEVIHCGSTKNSSIGEPLPALGYSLTFNNQRIVYTGDCGRDSKLEPYIEGADLLIIEATLKQSGGEVEQRVHLSLDKARELAALSAKTFIIHRTGKLPLIEI